MSESSPLPAAIPDLADRLKREPARPWLRRVRDDLAGGFVSAAVALPLALGFGMFVFVTLGDAYFPRGALAGLVAASVGGIVCVLLGERTVTVYAPRITTTFFLGVLLYSLAHSQEAALRGAPAQFTLLVLFAIMMLAGLFQALFGVLRLGTLIKFAPHPVMAGFQNMAALLLFLVQLGNVLGYEHVVPFTRALGEIETAKPLSIAVAAVTFASMWNARRIVPRIPPLLVGLAIGVAVYYGLKFLGLSAALGPTIGVPSAGAVVPAPHAELMQADNLGRIVAAGPTVIFGALALAIISAIDAMLCARLLWRPGDRRGDSNRMLVRLGLANVAVAAAGGITSGINIGASTTNRAFGGHSRLSVVFNATLLLGAIFVIMPVVAYLPRAVLSALIMVVAVQHFDPWSRQAASRLFKKGIARNRALAIDFGVALLVSVLCVTVDIVLAVFLGLALAVSLFLLRMSRSNLRRLYRCGTLRSRKARTAEQMKALEGLGTQILVIELQSALFFGSAERLAQIIEAETAQPTRVLILDLRRVTEIDSTGMRILGEIDAELSRRDIALILVLRVGTEAGARLSELPGRRRLPDLDRAIEQAEDGVLGTVFPSDDPPRELPLEDMSLLRDLTADQVARLIPLLQRREWVAGNTIFEQGDPGKYLFFVTRGRASARLQSGGGGIRLATFAPGTVFGELALLDGRPRSATVTADDALTTYALSDEGFRALQAREPEVAIKILSALGGELSHRLRQANMTIHQLEA
jgi:MFS superfamily sulfate permease-like transporter